VSGKVDYVLGEARADQGSGHTCHWPGCTRKVPPAMWGCRPHWFALPKPIRDAIWRTYRPGQERDRQPSAAYIDAARQARDWIEANAAPDRQRSLLL
jgi:hypothetical protein